MKGILVLPTMLLAGMAWADWMYNPNNPNPTQHDVWKAEQNAFEHGQRAAGAMSSPDTWASIREQEKANQARRDADQMRMRMWDNERREREQQQRKNEMQGGWHGFAPENAPAVPVVANQAPRLKGRALSNKVEEMMRNVRKNRRAIDKELKSLGVVNWQYLIKPSGTAPSLDAWYELKSNRGFRLTAYKKIYSEEDLIPPVDLAKKLMAK